MPKSRMTPAYTTRLGRAYHADALDVLRHLPDDSVSLVLTSPPFALRRKKAYGNVAADEYVDWFWPFAEEIHRVLRPDGSFVLDLAGGLEPRQRHALAVPVRADPAAVQALPPRPGVLLVQPVAGCRRRPSGSPSAARASRTPSTRSGGCRRPTTPQADNRRVLRPYSRSMQRLLRDGYEPAHAAVAARHRAALPAATTAAPSRPTCCTVAQHRSQRRLPPPLPGRPGCRSTRPASRRRCRSSSSAS